MRRAPYVEEACAKLRTSRRRVPSSACRRGGGEANAEARRASWLWGSGSGHVSVAPTGDGRQQWPRPRPREAHAAAHLRIVPVDAPSTPDQPPELRLIAVPCGLIHGLVHRVAHCALQTFARLDSCAFGGGTRGSAVTLGRRRRAHSVAVRMQLAHTPLGGRGSRAGARARRGRSKRPRRAIEAAAPPGSRGPEQRGVGVRSSWRSSWRIRPSGATRALALGARPRGGVPNSRSPLAWTVRNPTKQ